MISRPYFFADFGNGFKIAVRGHNDAAARRDGLQNDSAHGVGVFLLHHGFQFAGKLFTQILGAFGIGRTVGQAGGKFHKTGGKGPVLLAAFFLPAGAQGADGGAVVVAGAVDDLVFFAAVLELRNLAYHFEGFFVGFGAAAGNIDPRKTGHVRKQLFRKINGRLGTAAGRIKGQLFHLLGSGIDDALPPVAHVDAPDAARSGVQIFLAVQICKIQPLAFHRDHGRIALMQHQMVPYVFYVPVGIFTRVLRRHDDPLLEKVLTVPDRPEAALRSPGHPRIPRSGPTEKLRRRLHALAGMQKEATSMPPGQQAEEKEFFSPFTLLQCKKDLH